jgi:hypothetical protein
MISKALVKQTKKAIEWAKKTYPDRVDRPLHGGEVIVTPTTDEEYNDMCSAWLNQGDYEEWEA